MSLIYWDWEFVCQDLICCAWKSAETSKCWKICFWTEMLTPLICIVNSTSCVGAVCYFHSFIHSAWFQGRQITENHFSSCEYSQTSAGDTYKDMFSVSWEELGVNHLNGSVNAIAQHHHHTIIPTNLKLLKPGNHLKKGWQTTYLKPNPHVFTEPAN